MHDAVALYAFVTSSTGVGESTKKHASLEVTGQKHDILMAILMVIIELHRRSGWSRLNESAFLYTAPGDCSTADPVAGGCQTAPHRFHKKTARKA